MIKGILILVVSIGLYLYLGAYQHLQSFYQTKNSDNYAKMLALRPMLHEVKKQTHKLRFQLKSDEKNPTLWWRLAHLYVIQEKFDKAIESIEVAIQLAPDNISLQEDFLKMLNQVAVKAYQAGDMDKATRYWQKMLASLPAGYDIASIKKKLPKDLQSKIT